MDVSTKNPILKIQTLYTTGTLYITLLLSIYPMIEYVMTVYNTVYNTVNYIVHTTVHTLHYITLH